ncbi:ATP-dependent DNA helicase [Trichonephila clavipes]|nr:ATP-dependent DNA helicase [Trichonephila clavipes]
MRKFKLYAQFFLDSYISSYSIGNTSLTRPEIVSFDVDLRREQSYNISDFQLYVQSNIPKLTYEQKGICDHIMQMINDGFGGFFLEAPGGTGKTFLIRLILAMVRSKNDIALSVASSGIAATLLPGGRTAHSALKLPWNIQTINTTTCNISKTSDRSLQDLRENVQPFGNALILLAGDFRQTLPVISRSTPADEINACLKYSTLWRHVHILQFTVYSIYYSRTVDYEYACPASKRSISRGILPTVTGHWKRTTANR